MSSHVQAPGDAEGEPTKGTGRANVLKLPVQELPPPSYILPRLARRVAIALQKRAPIADRARLVVEELLLAAALLHLEEHGKPAGAAEVEAAVERLCGQVAERLLRGG